MKQLSEQDGLSDFFIDRISPTDSQPLRVPKGHQTQAEKFNAAAVEAAEKFLDVRVPEMFLQTLNIYQSILGGLVFDAILDGDKLSLFVVDNANNVLEVCYDARDYSLPGNVKTHDSWKTAKKKTGAKDIWNSLNQVELNFLTNMPDRHV